MTLEWHDVGGGSAARIEDNGLPGGVLVKVVQHGEMWRMDAYIYVGLEWLGVDSGNSALVIESGLMERDAAEAVAAQVKAKALDLWTDLRAKHEQFGGVVIFAMGGEHGA